MQSQIDFQQKSTFVSVTAWVFIVLSGIFTLVSLLQNIMIHVMFSSYQMQQAMEASSQNEQMPHGARFILEHFQLFIGLVLVFAVVTLVSSIGLLLRKKWARLIFIGILGVGIVWNIVGLVFQLATFSSMTKVPSNAPADFQSEFHIMATVISIISAVFVVVLTGVFGWIIKRLLSNRVKREFNVEG